MQSVPICVYASHMSKTVLLLVKSSPVYIPLSLIKMDWQVCSVGLLWLYSCPGTRKHLHVAVSPALIYLSIPTLGDIWYWGSRGLMVTELDSLSKGCEFESRAGRICKWGEWMYRALSPPSIPRLRCPWARHRTPQHKWLPTAPGVFTAVCVYFGWVNAEHKFHVWVTILGCMSRQ